MTVSRGDEHGWFSLGVYVCAIAIGPPCAPLPVNAGDAVLLLKCFSYLVCVLNLKL